jgi:hypothetical protein
MPEAWEVLATRGASHVCPVDDLRPHLVSPECWCHPTDDEGVWVHNAMDRRELVERGEQRSS